MLFNFFNYKFDVILFFIFRPLTPLLCWNKCLHCYFQFLKLICFVNHYTTMFLIKNVKLTFFMLYFMAEVYELNFALHFIVEKQHGTRPKPSIIYLFFIKIKLFYKLLIVLFWLFFS